VPAASFFRDEVLDGAEAEALLDAAEALVDATAARSETRK